MINDKLQGLVNKQAEDEGLWFVAETVPEAYLQRALRKLHAVIEGREPPFNSEQYAKSQTGD